MEIISKQSQVDIRNPQKSSQQWMEIYSNVIKCHRERTLWYFVFLTSIAAADYTSVI